MGKISTAQDTDEAKKVLSADEDEKEIGQLREALEEEIAAFKQKQIRFEREKRDFQKRRAQENQLFDLKWKLLEEEAKRLAEEESRIEKKRNFYERVRQEEQGSASITMEITRGDKFFAGVTSELALKKRYKDLIKIYHPDNVSGDTDTLQEINREYDALKARWE